jgi:hypothetical protein
MTLLGRIWRRYLSQHRLCTQYPVSGEATEWHLMYSGKLGRSGLLACEAGLWFR